jgi:hypothetical protein
MEPLSVQLCGTVFTAASTGFPINYLEFLSWLVVVYPATGHNPEPGESGTNPNAASLRFISISSSYLHLGLHSCLIPSVFPSRNLYALTVALIYATYSANLVILHLIIVRKFGWVANYEASHSAILPTRGLFI